MNWKALAATKWIVAIVLSLMAAANAAAQGYPNRPIRLVVPYPPGGATDQLARIIQQPLQELLGQSIIVDNKPGAAGAIGTYAVATAAPDGYTLVFGNSGPNSMGPALKKATYDPIKDLAPISIVAKLPLFLTVHPSVPANNVREFIELVKANPGKYNYGSTGIGSGSHLISELFNFITGLDMIHVPYKGGAPLMFGFVRGEVQAVFMSGLDGATHVRGGKLKVLAVATDKPTSLAPGMPTIEETVPNFNGVLWFGLLGPAGMPPEAVNRVKDAVAMVVARPNVNNAFRDLWAEAASNTPDQFAKTISAELAQWTKLVKESGRKFE